MPPAEDKFSLIAAYQRVQLLEIRELFDRLAPQVEHYLQVEEEIDHELLFLEDALARIGPRTNAAISKEANNGETAQDQENDRENSAPVDGPQYGRIRSLFSFSSFAELETQAEKYLASSGFDLSKDPLLQILDTAEISAIATIYRKKYGDASWRTADYVVVGLAGLAATLVDIFLVKTPETSPFTRALKDYTVRLYEDKSLQGWWEALERKARVPYDAVNSRMLDQTVAGLNQRIHRLMSLGHDPGLALIFGVLDILHGTGTFIDKYGALKIARNLSYGPETDVFEAVIKVVLHLLSDGFTRAGLQPPFFSLLQLLNVESPFSLGPSAEKVSWTNLARYMYVHGYDLRHYLTMGLVPATVEIIIRAYWLFTTFDQGVDPEKIKVKLSSMLLLGHTMALSGNLVKTGLMYSVNPLALNWATLQRTTIVAISTFRESIKRDKILRDKLDQEWLRIYVETNPGGYL
jgi:hypothetical protein